MDSTLPVIVMTAWGNVELAVEAMRRGARDFIQKPWENERLLAILRTQVELHRALAASRTAGGGEPSAPARRAVPSSLPPRRPCSQCWKPSLASVPPTPMS